jgi:HPr kinase/phosphorylase
VADLPTDEQTIHATTVSLDGRGLIILGPSGSGKSALALQLLALGAVLVSDDQTRLTLTPQGLIANCPPTIAGMIEARGVGILTVPFDRDVPICLAVDMGRNEQERLPEPHRIELIGHSLPCLHKIDGPQFAAALLLFLKNMQPQRNE